MWWSDGQVTRRGALLGVLALSACGFVPAYGTGGGLAVLRGQTVVTGPETVPGFRLRTHLEDRLGLPQGAPAYALSTTLSLRQEGAAITQGGATTRFSVVGVAGYRLTDATGRLLASGEVDSFTAYSTTGSTVATQAAQEDAQARLAAILGDLILTRLIAVDAGA